MSVLLATTILHSNKFASHKVRDLFGHAQCKRKTETRSPLFSSRRHAMKRQAVHAGSWYSDSRMTRIYWAHCVNWNIQIDRASHSHAVGQGIVKVLGRSARENRRWRQLPYFWPPSYHWTVSFHWIKGRETLLTQGILHIGTLATRTVDQQRLMLTNAWMFRPCRWRWISSMNFRVST